MHAIALDIGGTKIEGVLFNEKYKILKKKRVFFDKKKSDDTINTSRKKVLGMICGLIDELKPYRVKGIGISIPGVVDEKEGYMVSCKITSLRQFALGKYLKRKYKCKITINNDADCFALGEAILGAGKDYQNVIGAIWGTGVGSGIIINKKIYSGTTGSAGEFGHNIVNPAGPKERHGFSGTVEAFAGGPNIVRNYIKVGGRMSDPDPKKLFYSKDRKAKKVLEDAYRHLSIGLASLMNILNPGIIVIGGGLSNLPVYRKLNSYTKKYTIDGLRPHVKVVKNKLGDSAGIYGAAALVFD